MKKYKNQKHFKEIVKTLEELNSRFPSYDMGRHLSTALFEKGDIWGMSNKEIAESLKEHQASLEMDEPHKDSEIARIVEDAMDLRNILEDEDDFIDGQHY